MRQNKREMHLEIWPLVVLYALLDVKGINTQILFSLNKNNTQEYRRIFLKKLALGLMQHILRKD